MSLPVTRPAGRALLVGTNGCRTEPLGQLGARGFQCGEADDPYAATLELVKRGGSYQCVVFGLQSFYREELSLIATIKRRWPHLDVWLTQTDGRTSAMAEAMRLGADGLLTEDGLLRTAVDSPPGPSLSLFRPVEEGDAATVAAADPEEPAGAFAEDMSGEPVLTAEELRALLQEPPFTATRKVEQP